MKSPDAWDCCVLVLRFWPWLLLMTAAGSISAMMAYHPTSDYEARTVVYIAPRHSAGPALRWLEARAMSPEMVAHVGAPVAASMTKLELLDVRVRGASREIALERIAMATSLLDQWVPDLRAREHAEVEWHLTRAFPSVEPISRLSRALVSGLGAAVALAFGIQGRLVWEWWTVKAKPELIARMYA